MAINLDKKEKKNSCLIPFLVVLVIIAAFVAGIGLLWGVTGYIWFLRILGVIFAFVAFCGLSSTSGVGCLITIICGIFAALCFWGGNTIEKNYAESMPSVSTSSSYGSDVSSQTPTYENEVSSQVEEDSPYIDNRLQTGDSPYKNIRLSGNESTIEVKTSEGYENDVVVIIKHNGKIVRNAYIQGGDSYQFSVPNGTYQVFFYGGKGWNPDKKMDGGYTGGFITNESFSKDNAVTLDYQGLNYELIPQRNGNFNTELSSETEMF